MDRRTFERLLLQDDVERRALMREVERKRDAIRAQEERQRAPASSSSGGPSMGIDK